MNTLNLIYNYYEFHNSTVISIHLPAPFITFMPPNFKKCHQTSNASLARRNKLQISCI